MKKLNLVVGILLSISVASFAQSSKKKNPKGKHAAQKTEVKSDSSKTTKKWENKDRPERKARPDSLKAKNPNFKNGKAVGDSTKFKPRGKREFRDSTKSKGGEGHHNHQH